MNKKETSAQYITRYMRERCTDAQLMSIAAEICKVASATQPTSMAVALVRICNSMEGAEDSDLDGWVAWAQRNEAPEAPALPEKVNGTLSAHAEAQGTGVEDILPKVTHTEEEWAERKRVENHIKHQWTRRFGPGETDQKRELCFLASVVVTMLRQDTDSLLDKLKSYVDEEFVDESEQA